jgi:hypothetical protein
LPGGAVEQGEKLIKSGKKDGNLTQACEKEGGRVEPYELNKPLKIAINVFLLSFIIAAWIMMFDDQPQNDSIGWMSLIAFWVFKGLYDAVMNLKNGRKKTALLDLLLTFVALSVLIWGIKRYFN